MTNKFYVIILTFLLFACKENTTEMKEKTIDTNNESISYYDTENGITTLLFIHGAFIDKEYWKEQLNHFSPNYRVVALDLAGHGKSSTNRENWTIEIYGKDISKFIEKLDLKNVILIGHSIGGDIMLEAINNYDKKIIGIIGVDYFKNVGFELPKDAVDGLIANLKNDFESTTEQYVNQQLITSQTNQEIANRITTDFKTMNPEIGLSINQNSFGYSKRELELLSNLKRKPFLINVNYFPTNEESIKNILADNYKLYEVDGTCHYPMIEKPSEFNTTLQKAVAEIEKAG